MPDSQYTRHWIKYNGVGLLDFTCAPIIGQEMIVLHMTEYRNTTQTIEDGYLRRRGAE